jgi:hypothetical protein
MAKQKLVTRQQVIAIVNAKWEAAQKGDTEARRFLEQYIGKALMVLLDRQTQDEQRDTTVKYRNEMGFTGADGRSGTIAARTYLKYKGFPEDWMLKQWVKPNRRGVPRIAKYWRQLNEAAIQKARKAAYQQLKLNTGCTAEDYRTATHGA